MKLGMQQHVALELRTAFAQDQEQAVYYLLAGTDSWQFIP